MPPQPDPKLPPLVGLTGAASLLGTTRQAAHELYKRGNLPGAAVEGAPRKTLIFRREAVEALRDARNTAAGHYWKLVRDGVDPHMVSKQQVAEKLGIDVKSVKRGFEAAEAAYEGSPGTE